MKKNYLCALALSIGSLSFAQTVRLKNTIAFDSDKHQVFESPKNTGNHTPQDKGALLWNDDFSVPSNWTMTNTSIPAIDWSIVTDINLPPATGMAPFTAPTAANGYLFISSDGIGGGDNNGTPTVVTAEIATAINLSSNPLITLTFQQNYRWWQDSRTVRVSGDNGVTWTDFVITDGFASPTPQQTPLSEKISLDISTVAGGQPQVLIQFVYNDNDIWAWYWAVDDVEIRVTDNNDLMVTNGYYGTAAFPYSRIPVNQIQPIDFLINATNIGALDQTNTILTADINSGTFTSTSTPITVVTGATDTLVATTQFTPPTTVAVPYNVTLTVTSDSADADPANNTTTFPPFEISNFIYAYDDYGTPGVGGGDNGGVSEFEAGNYFDIFVSDALQAIDVVIGAGTPTGTNIEGVLYEIDPANGNFNVVITTSFYSTTAGDIGNVVSLPFANPQTLNAGSTYFIAVHTFTTFFYGTSGTSPDGQGTAAQTSLIFYPTMSLPNTNQNFYTSNTPMIRMNFDPSIGVNELNENTHFSVSPNPSNGEFNIDLDTKVFENVTLSVKNILGKTILTRDLSLYGKTKETISLANYSKGIYFLTINNRTTKLIVE